MSVVLNQVWAGYKINNQIEGKCWFHQIWTVSEIIGNITLVVMNLFSDTLTLYMLNFSVGTKTYIHILCHSSTLTWHIVEIFPQVKRELTYST